MGPVLSAIQFPDFDPVAISLGPLDVRWYSLAYAVGFLGGWWLMKRLADRPPHLVAAEKIDDFLFWCILGTILGGRLGFTLLYYPDTYLRDPISILYVWEGGMAFHGGLIGVTLAIVLFARRIKVHPFAMGDLVACAVPIGLFFGRIANFVNGELWGRISDVSWAVVFPDPRALGQPRHPSQLYEAAVEGLLAFLILMVLVYRFDALKRPGLCIGVFLNCYGFGRFMIEYVREADRGLALMENGSGSWTPRFVEEVYKTPGFDPIAFVSMGQILCLPMIAAGLAFMAYALLRDPVPDNAPPPMRVKKP